MALTTSKDAAFLSPLQAYIRAHCMEYFAAPNPNCPVAATNQGTKKRKSGNNKKKSNKAPSVLSGGYIAPGRRAPVVEGRIGVRCVFCKDAKSRASSSTSFPSQLGSIYSSVTMIQCRHLPNCREIPSVVRKELARLKREGNTPSPIPGGSGAPRQQYWVESALEAGLINSDEGVKANFSSKEEGPRGKEKKGDAEVEECTTNADFADAAQAMTNDVEMEKACQAIIKLHTPKPHRPNVISPVETVAILGVNGSDLVSLDDKELVPSFLFLALAQVRQSLRCIALLYPYLFQAV